MINQFDSANYPETEPGAVVVGERWAWKRPDITSAYPTTLYTLLYRLCLQEAAHSDISITASKISSEHVVEVASATTAAYAAGDYSWQAVIVRDSDSEELVLNTGYMTLKPDFGSHSGDTRSWARQALDAIRAVLLNTASKEESEYSIAGRSLKRRTSEELLTLEKEFSRRVSLEEKQLDIENGRPTNNKRVYMKLEA